MASAVHWLVSGRTTQSHAQWLFSCVTSSLEEKRQMSDNRLKGTPSQASVREELVNDNALSARRARSSHVAPVLCEHV